MHYINEDIKSRLFRAYREKGLKFSLLKILRSILRRMKNLFLGLYFKIIPPPEFIFAGKKLRYIFHPYNTTWENERAVEVAIALAEIGDQKRGRLLEVGNVLNFYKPFRHDVVDKYEFGRNIINEDIVDFNPTEPYNTIVSISTMEHIGWDEEPKDKKKILRGFDNLIKNCLAPGGFLLVTCPLGFNPNLDFFLKEQKLPFQKILFMKRISSDNKWIEVDYKDVVSAEYGRPFPYANAIMIGIYISPTKIR